MHKINIKQLSNLLHCMYVFLVVIVGFSSPEYNASEGDGMLEITVGLLSGKLRGEILLSLTFSDSKYHTHAHMHTHIHTYTHTHTHTHTHTYIHTHTHTHTHTYTHTHTHVHTYFIVHYVSFVSQT